MRAIKVSNALHQIYTGHAGMEGEIILSNLEEERETEKVQSLSAHNQEDGKADEKKDVKKEKEKSETTTPKRPGNFLCTLCIVSIYLF